MSRVNYGAKPIMFPQPVLIVATYDENGVPDAMNAAWGITTDFNEISISMSEHKTTENAMKRKAFTVSMATEDWTAACDYVGIESANEVPDKFARAGFHATKSEYVDAPLIDELPMALECRVKSFNDGILIGGTWQGKASQVCKGLCSSQGAQEHFCKDWSSLRTSHGHEKGIRTAGTGPMPRHP